MNIQSLQEILIKNNFEHHYYELIFNLLSSDYTQISSDDRKTLFSIIQNENFYSYSEQWHLSSNGLSYEKEGFIQHLTSLNKFHESNHAIHNETIYQSFLNNNLMPIIISEVNNFFNKEFVIYKGYDDYTEQQTEVYLYFLSPSDLYNNFKVNNFFPDLLESKIKPTILQIEQEHLSTENPVIKQGLSILNKAFENPQYFAEFIPFWTTYKKMLLPSNSPENDLEIISKVNPEIHDSYCDYMKQQGIHYEFEKSILSQKISQFYFEHFEEFISYSGKIPNPLVWIYESRKFFSIQNAIDNIEEKHFEYFKDFNHSSFFQKFITEVLFAQRFSNEVSYNKVKSLLNKNFNFENLFINFDIQQPSSEDLSNFENYLLKLNKNLETDDLLAFYRVVKLENKLDFKNNPIKKMKI